VLDVVSQGARRFPLQVTIRRVAGLAQGDSHQQVPKLIPVGQVEVAATLARAEALYML
jgi:hypothetical protein